MSRTRSEVADGVMARLVAAGANPDDVNVQRIIAAGGGVIHRDCGCRFEDHFEVVQNVVPEPIDMAARIIAARKGDPVAPSTPSATGDVPSPPDMAARIIAMRRKA